MRKWIGISQFLSDPSLSLVQQVLDQGTSITGGKGSAEGIATAVDATTKAGGEFQWIGGVLCNSLPSIFSIFRELQNPLDSLAVCGGH